MDLVFSELNNEVLLVYLNDIIAHSSNFEENFQRLEMLFNRLVAADLKLKPSKCHLLLLFLGHLVNMDGISTDEDKLPGLIDSWPFPRNLKKVRSFMGLCSYYRKYIRDLA